jgi:hypothetical protein
MDPSYEVVIAMCSDANSKGNLLVLGSYVIDYFESKGKTIELLKILLTREITLNRKFESFIYLFM